MIDDVVIKVDTWNPSRSNTTTAFSYIDLSSVHQERKEISAVRRTLPAEAPSRARQLVCTGDVLISTVRPNLNAVAYVTSEFDGATASTGFAVLRPSPRVNGRYLFHWVRTPNFVDAMVRQATGASYPAVSDRTVKGSTLPLPPIEEQRRIASILDHADELRAREALARDLLTELARAAFAELDVSAAPTVPLGNLARIIRGASPRPAGDPRYFGGPIPWLKISDVTTAPGRFVEHVKEGVTPEGRSKSVLIPAGTLILTNSATVGIPKIMAVDTCIHDGFLAFLDLNPEIDQRYLYAVLLASRDALVNLAPHGTQKNLNTTIVKSFGIPVPRIAVQRRFAQRLEAVEGQGATTDARAAQLGTLVASLQARAFSGRM